jgi:hypothetical protein
MAATTYIFCAANPRTISALKRIAIKAYHNPGMATNRVHTDAAPDISVTIMKYHLAVVSFADQARHFIHFVRRTQYAVRPLQYGWPHGGQLLHCGRPERVRFSTPSSSMAMQTSERDIVKI